MERGYKLNLAEIKSGGRGGGGEGGGGRGEGSGGGGSARTRRETLSNISPTRRTIGGSRYTNPRDRRTPATPPGSGGSSPYGSEVDDLF